MEYRNRTLVILDIFSVLLTRCCKLIYNFDQEFYLICNPDVRKYHEGAFAHWVKHGRDEHRIFTSKKCFVKNFYISLETINSLLKNVSELEIPEISEVLSSELFQIPWRPGIAGFPSKIVSLKIKLKNRPSNDNQISNEHKIILRKKSLFKYEILLNYDQL